MADKSSAKRAKDDAVPKSGDGAVADGAGGRGAGTNQVKSTGDQGAIGDGAGGYDPPK